jgi:hypothetical protein
MTDITITIKRREKDKKRNQNKDSKKSLLPTYHKGRGGRRRLKKQSGFIQFYDLGQIKSGGNWIDLPFQFVPDDIAYDSGQANRMFLENFDADNWADLFDKIFEVPIGEWKENYRKLDFDSAYSYGIDYFTKGDYAAVAKPNQRPRLIDILTVSEPPNSANDNWTAEGFKVESAQTRVQILSFNAFYDFDTADTETFKITETNNFEADAATISLPENFDIFLVPKITINSLVSAIPTEVSGLGFQQYLLNAFYSALPRKLLFDLNLQNYLFDFAYSYWHETDYRTVAIGSAAAAAFLNYFKTLPDARLFYLDFGDSVNLTPPRKTAALSAFPTSGISADGFWFRSEAAAIGNAGSDTNAATYASGLVADETGVLLAVIKSDTKTYFVWKNTSSAFPFSGFSTARINFK